MLRPFLKSQNLRRAISLGNYARGCSTNTNLADQNASKRKINLAEQPCELTTLRKSVAVRKSTSNLDSLIRNVSECTTLSRLLELIQPHLAELNDKHLNVIFSKLNDLFFNKPEFDRERVPETKRILNNSPVFKSLMDQTNRLVHELSTSSLLCLLHTFSLAALDPQFVIVKRTISELNARLDVLEQDAVIECAKQLHYYLGGIAFTKQLFEFNARVLQALKKDLLVNRIDPQNVRTTMNFWFIFLKPENDPKFEIVEYMTKQLLASDVKLSFKHAVLLMRKIKLNHYLYRERLNKPHYTPMRNMFKDVEFNFRKKTLFPRLLTDLIDKCNSVIYETLCLQATSENFHYFFNKLHDFTDDIGHELPNFYAPKILYFVTPYVIQNIESSNRLKGLVFELLQNYAKFNIYDEKLVKLTYDLYLRDEKLRSKIDGSHFYFILAKYRLPFIDHGYLSKLLFNFSTGFHKSSETKTNPLRVLCELILNDVENETLLKYLHDIVDNLSDNYWHNFKSINSFKQMALARHYLTTKNNLDDRLKSKLVAVLDQAIYSVMIFDKKPLISYGLFSADHRFQKNGYLSNGVYLDTFAIYDSLTGDLIPMTYDLINAFKHKIEKIPRTKSQEMYVFGALLNFLEIINKNF